MLNIQNLTKHYPGSEKGCLCLTVLVITAFLYLRNRKTVLSSL